MGNPILTDADFQLAELTAQFNRFFAHGAPHLHALLSLAKELSTRNCRLFDVEGRHPNIQSAKSKEAVRRYLMKDGDYIVSDTVPANTQSMSM